MAVSRPFSIPRPESKIIEQSSQGTIIGKDWYTFLVNLYNTATQGLTQATSVVTLTASPMTYTTTVKGQMILNGGTVSSVSLSRDGTNFITTGIIAGIFPMGVGDKIRITYTVAPTLTFYPL